MNKVLLSHLHKYTVNNKYLKHYVLLCEKAFNRSTTKSEAKRKIGYVESHHIIPVSYDASISKEKWNIVHLSAREHFVAHKLLIHASKDEYKNKAKHAISKFIQSNHLQHRVFSNRDYQFIREIIQENMVGIRNPMYGKPGTTNGKICITNGIDNKFIDINSTIPYGWGLGMNKPNTVITNGTDERRINIKDEIPNGWWVGSVRKGKSTKLKGKKLGKYNKSRIDNQKKALNSLKFSFYTNGTEDIKIPNGNDIPFGFWRGRTFGKYTITTDMINRSLKSFNVASIEELEKKLKYDLENNVNTIGKLKNKYKKLNSICKNNDPNIQYFINKFNLTKFIVKGKTGPKSSN